MHHRANYKISQ